MRLLHIEGDAWNDEALKITLCEKIGADVPPYMILSHRWRDDEVLFTDMISSDPSIAPKRKGYAKLEASCLKALQMGLQYAWIDTCCIDKSSSAELSETINSMYQYYARSAICFAYLDDVDAGSVQTGSFRESCWFERGWTLQELIAPKEVYFYSRDWKSLGTRTSLRKQVNATSGVAEQVLIDPQSLKDFSIAEKMSWAARRETTREEDESYSLMGVFGVNMPPLYGEGRERAFHRLQIEIMQNSHDHTLFAWNRSSMSGGMLATSVRDFLWSSVYRRMKIADYTATFHLDNPKLDYAMTNVGLHIELMIASLPVNNGSEPLYLALLACSFTPNEDCLVAICLRKQTTPGVSRYHRVCFSGSSIFHIMTSRQDLRKHGFTGFIKFEPTVLWVYASSAVFPDYEETLTVTFHHPLAYLYRKEEEESYARYLGKTDNEGVSRILSRVGFPNELFKLNLRVGQLYIALGEINGVIWIYVAPGSDVYIPIEEFRFPTGKAWRCNRQNFHICYPKHLITVEDFISRSHESGLASGQGNLTWSYELLGNAERHQLRLKFSESDS